MKKIILTTTILFGGMLVAQAQSISITNPLAAKAYNTLMNKDMATVMKELKLSAKDTVGKTGQAIYSKIDPVNKITTLKMKDGQTLGFKANKLVAILPKTTN